ncbi:MAG: uL22 family ribosomal protein, partial [archaeon]
KAKNILERVIQKKQAIPYRVYNKSIPHRKGNMATGRYPIKTSSIILKLLNSAEKNAQNKGLLSKLYICAIYANKGPKQFHYSRHRGRVMKRTHLTIILKEKLQQKKSAKQTEEKVKENK